MRLHEALATNLPLKRASEEHWAHPSTNGFFTAVEILADDWQVKQEPCVFEGKPKVVRDWVDNFLSRSLAKKVKVAIETLE